ncbi:hypothetical protein JCM3774_002478 [Rhodotorula dairenensis]
MRTSTTAVLVAAAACVTSVHALSYSHGHPQNARRHNHHHDLARRSHDQANVSGRMTRKMRRGADSNADQKTTYESTAIWWAEAGWIGSCGDNVSDDAMIIALPLALYPDVSTASPLCGTTVSVSAPSTGKSITATVIGASDRTAYTTFSRAAYQALGGDLDSGELPIRFQLVDGKAPASASVTASDGAALKSIAATAAQASAGGDSSSSNKASASSSSSSSQDKASSSASSSSSGGKSFASGSENVHAAAAPSTTAAAATTTTEAAWSTTTEAPKQQATTTTPEWDSASAASESAKSKSLADAAWASSSSASAAEAYAFWASSSSSAAAAGASAASKSSADAAWASSSSAAAAAASKSAADAAWASSSSASAAAAAKQTQSSSSSPSSGGGHVYSGGIATFFYQNGVAGNCGQVNSDDTPLVALPTATYAGGSHCGQYVEITRTDTGNKIKALVADSCPTCNNDSCLDLSWGAFSALGGTQSMGVFDITWQFV